MAGGVLEIEKKKIEISTRQTCVLVSTIIGVISGEFPDVDEMMEAK